MIDPGHGGHDPGAVSPDGKTMEKNLALTLASRLHNLFNLTNDVTPFQTRNDDKFLMLGERAGRANAMNACLLSIHFNAGGGYGVEVFTSPGTTPSDAWADAVIHRFRVNPSIPKVRVDRSDGDDDKEAKFTVLTKTAKPAILVECGFLDNEKDLANCRDPKYLEAVAQAIYKGTCQHFGLNPYVKGEKPGDEPEKKFTRKEFHDSLIKWAESYESIGMRLLRSDQKLEAHEELWKGYAARLAANLVINPDD